MAGSLTVASTTALLAKVAVVESAKVGRSAMYRRYNDDPRTLSLHMPAYTGKSFVYSFSTFTRKCLLCKYDFRIRK
jgi:hypothetical protein